MALLDIAHSYFAAVAENRSIREAADKLHISQSAISRQIQNLEERMGCILLERGSRGVTLTASGQILLGYIRESMSLDGRMAQDLDRLRGVYRGHVVVSMVEAFAAHGFPELLNSFRQKNPAVTLEVLVEGSQAIRVGVEDGRFDIGVIFNPHSAGLRIISRIRTPLCALMGPHHPLARRKVLGISDVLPYPLVAPAGTGGSRELAVAALKQVRAPPNIVIETNSAHVAAAFLRNSNGIGILSPLSAAPYIQQKVLLGIPMRETILQEGHLAVVTRVGRVLEPPAEILCSMFCAAFQRLEQTR